MSDVVADLREARANLEEADAAVAEYGASVLERLREARADAVRLLGRYEGSATGTGDFEAYVEFQGLVADLVDDVDDDLPRSEAFERYDDVLDQRRLSSADFQRAREALEPVAELASLLDEREAARESHGRARRAAEARRDALDAEIERLERVSRLADADPDVSVADLRDPVTAYDEAATAAVAEALTTRPARDVLDWLDRLDAFPLVDAPRVPPGLLSYVREHEAGEESVDTLLEYAGESISKLGHYVDEPATLKRVVGSNRSFLRRLDGEFLTLGWPPERAAVLRYHASELVSALNRIDADDAVARLREVRAFARSSRYERLRAAAVARVELTEEERTRVANGGVEGDLRDARTERERIDEALATIAASVD